MESNWSTDISNMSDNDVIQFIELIPLFLDDIAKLDDDEDEILAFVEKNYCDCFKISEALSAIQYKLILIYLNSRTLTVQSLNISIHAERYYETINILKNKLSCIIDKNYSAIHCDLQLFSKLDQNSIKKIIDFIKEHYLEINE